jgi:cysteine-rich repeat protein
VGMNKVTCWLRCGPARGFAIFGIILAAATLAALSCTHSGLQDRDVDGSTGGDAKNSGPVSGSGGAGARDGGLVIVLPPPVVCVCGDGVVCKNYLAGQYEQCDDGNTKNSDGCTGKCLVEDGWICPAQGKPCQPTRSDYACGNGILRPNEACDDGNTIGGDGCSGDCQTIEPGSRCPVPGRSCTRVCGDAGQPCAQVAICGDGIVTPNEECDDGDDPSKNPHNGDSAYGGCTTACTYGPYCGDGIVNGTEECDDGQANVDLYSGDKPGCSYLCTMSYCCGDGIVDPDYGEECDLGGANGSPGTMCDYECHYII